MDGSGVLGYSTTVHNMTLTLPGHRHKQNENELDKLTSGVIGLFTGPHHTSFLEESSSTMRLSDGERPVLAPEYAERAPLAVMAEPVSYTRASS
jgi:hypothetical protein